MTVCSWILSATMLSTIWPPPVYQWKESIVRWAVASHVPPDIVAGVILYESGGSPDKVGYAGEIGLMQVFPNTIEGFEWREGATPEVLYDPNMNISWGTAILSVAKLQANGNYRNALGAYNCGWDGLREKQCGTYGGYAYADKILASVPKRCFVDWARIE